jgi:hypothetical protein
MVLQRSLRVVTKDFLVYGHARLTGGFLSDSSAVLRAGDCFSVGSDVVTDGFVQIGLKGKGRIWALDSDVRGNSIPAQRRGWLRRDRRQAL